MDWQKTPWAMYTLPRNVDNLDTPWVPSPDTFAHDAKLYHATPTRTRCETISGPPGHRFLRAFRGLRRLIGRSLQLMAQEPRSQKVNLNLSSCNDVPEIPPSEWRAFAAYSRPYVNGVNVHNTLTPSPTPYRILDLDDEVDFDALFASLRSPSGEIHPERWIRGLTHPALPPPPTGWTLPCPGEPLAFPWDCQLNPFLVHAVCGPAPVYWNIRSGGLAILYGGPRDVAIPLSQADLAQPATYPLLTHMFVSGLAPAAARFPWKFMVVNTQGIRLRDVFGAILDNFQQCVFQREFDGWTHTQRRHAEVEWKLRGGEKTRDGLRRLDYLCGQLYFRGLAPNPDRTGWVLFVGPEW
ncbi:hypothetical protein C8R43DRAFT_933073 [Mycena crocata]|nr:hypothetical protein C8R43DRAFT_933073 [Mycena crocata]